MKALINDFGDETTMEKQHLPELLDDALLEKLYGFCYARTHDSLRAQELCSENRLSFFLLTFSETCSKLWIESIICVFRS